MKKIVLFSILLITAVGCQQVAKLIFGIKNPKLENPESVKEYIVKNDWDTQNNFIAKDTASYKAVIGLFYKSIPEAVLFDKNGNELIYKETSESCNAGLFKVIPDLQKDSQLKKGTHQLKNVLNQYTLSLDGNSNSIMDDSDYYLLIDWAIFTGKLNKDHVLPWENLAKNNKNCKIKVLKLNLDIQDNWGWTEKDIKIGGTKVK